MINFELTLTLHKINMGIEYLDKSHAKLVISFGSGKNRVRKVKRITYTKKSDAQRQYNEFHVKLGTIMAPKRKTSTEVLAVSTRVKSSNSMRELYLRTFHEDYTIGPCSQSSLQLPHYSVIESRVYYS